MSRLIRPTPTPPQMQFSHIPVNGVIQARGFRLSCMQLTEPFDVFVVRAAQVGPADDPKRNSLPSRLPNSCWTGNAGRVPGAGLSAPFLTGSRSTRSADRPA